MLQVRARGLELSALVVSALLVVLLAIITIWESSKLESEIALSVVFAFLFSITVWTMGLTVFTEPGFLPTMEELKAVSEDPLAMEKNKAALSAVNQAYWQYYSLDSSQAPTENYALHLHTHIPAAIAFKECHSCGTFKPTRSTTHCGEPSCGRCVLGKDHHCFFLGTCIGSRNRSQFIAFLISATATIALSSVIIVSDCVNFFKESVEPNITHDSLDLSFVEIALLSVLGVFALFKLLIFPVVFTFKTNQNLLIILFIYGLFTILFIIIEGHAPIMPALLGYATICIGIFIAMNLAYQISLLRKGSTLRQLVKQETAVEGTDSPLLGNSSDALDQFDEDDGMSLVEVIAFAAKGFWITSIPSMELEKQPTQDVLEEVDDALDPVTEEESSTDDIEAPPVIVTN